MRHNSLGIDAIFQYTGSGVQLFSGTIFYVVIARIFLPAEIGAITLFAALIGLLSILFTFGLNAAVQHFTSYNMGMGSLTSVKITIYKFIAYGFILSFVGLITLVLLGPIISHVFFHSTSYRRLVRLLSVVLFGNILYGILNGALLGLQKFKLSAIINISIWITYYFLPIIFALYSHSIQYIIFGWIIGISLGVVIELFTVLVLLRRFDGEGEPTQRHLIFRYSFPILLSGLISYGAASADRFVVSGLLSLSSLGIYNFALLVATSISFLVAPFNNILMPKFSEMFGSGQQGEIRSTVEISSTLLSSFYTPSALGIAALAPLILKLLGGDIYVEGAQALMVIMFSSAVFVIQNILIQAMAAIRRTRILIYSSFIALITNILVSILLIPEYGILGASIGFSSVYAATFFTVYFFAWKTNLLSFDNSSLLKVWISSIFMFLIVYFVAKGSGFSIELLPVYVALGAALYFGLARLLRVFKNESKQKVLSLFPAQYSKLIKIISILILY